MSTTQDPLTLPPPMLPDPVLTMKARSELTTRGLPRPSRDDFTTIGAQDRKQNLRGIVDMGRCELPPGTALDTGLCPVYVWLLLLLCSYLITSSNAIRFSISDLSPPTARILPTIHVHRIGISLYDEQFDEKTGKQIPIPEHVIRAVIASFRRFQVVCADLGVPENRIRVLATEATRTAINSAEFCKAVKAATDLTVEMLPKEQEGRVGALGISSSFSHVRGLVMDLGGGSTQITWMIAQEGKLTTSPKGAFSFPYGAAAMTRKLAELNAGKSKAEAEEARSAFRKELQRTFRAAYDELEVPDSLVQAAKRDGGFQLYLSGGGFRGWGYLLLYQNQSNNHHYPISIINGFWARKDDFENTEHLKDIAKSAHEVFRVSDRRRSQVPAVAFIVNALAGALPHGIKEARFCQGGVREGVLFQELSEQVRKQDPLEVATSPFAKPSAHGMGHLLLAAVPGLALNDEATKSHPKSFPDSINTSVIRSLANILFVHSDMAKESSSAAALYSTTTGILASSHGVSHADRALLALMFEERFQGELPPRETDFKVALRGLLTDEQIWWTRYLGKVAMLIARIYPAGVIEEGNPRTRIESSWVAGLGKRGDKQGLELKFCIDSHKGKQYMLKESLEELSGVITKVGKRKHWIGGKDGWGMKVKVVVEEQDWGVEESETGWVI